MAYHGMEKVSDYILTHKAVLILVCVVIFTLTVLCASQVMAERINPNLGATMYNGNGEAIYRLPGNMVVADTGMRTKDSWGRSYSLVHFIHYGELITGWVETTLIWK